MVLEFSYPSAYPRGVTNVKMRWLTPKHLEVIYKKDASIVFQAIKYGDIHVSAKQEERRNGGRGQEERRNGGRGLKYPE
jgi:hypothetical protein